MNRFVLLVILSLLWSLSVFANRYKVHKNIDYVKASERDYDNVRHKLDVYAPKEKYNTGKVFVFIHGGSWDTGRKELYKFVGRAFAANGIVTVVINYRLSPVAKYDGMAYDCARAVAWVKENIATYGGNPKEIFVGGHSAGGQLAALIVTDPTYFDKVGISNPVKGCILNDPFGLNIYKYLEHGYDGDATFRRTFTNSPQVWKKGSPIFHVKKDTIRYYIIHGGNTYPAVMGDSEDFHAKNIEVGNASEIHTVRHKRHIPMVLLFFRKHNKEVKKAIAFMMK
ncbi:MAG: alpha/beta hydrolase [Chitinophagaceae bacterium]|nr:alpha/beta hydrolase [Chitinophagaceae bacterium]